MNAAARRRARAAETTVIRGGRFLTADPARPTVDVAVLLGGVFTSVGDPHAAAAAARAGARVIELDGRTAIPGLIDPHTHVLATAAASLSADCSPSAAGSFAALLGQLRRQAETCGEAWVRGAGYDETGLEERRHPTRAELDAAFPDRPVVLKHGSGHALVLNSAACAELGMPRAAWADGLLTDRALPSSLPHLPFRQLAAACARISRGWRRRGITHICDVGADNGAAEVEAIQRLRAEGALLQEVTVFWSGEDLAGLDAYRPHSPLPIAGAKVVLDERRLAGDSPARLAALVRETRARGLLLAVHVVDLPCLAVVLDALERAAAVGTDASHVRLEHVSICPPDLIPRLRASGAMVVTQPLFPIERAERYRLAVPAAMRPWLYPIEGLMAAGVTVAGSSDSPVGEADPLRAIASLGERAIRARGEWSRDERLAAFGLFTHAAANAVGGGEEFGSATAGLRADPLALSVDPLRASPTELATATVEPLLDSPRAEGAEAGALAA